MHKNIPSEIYPCKKLKFVASINDDSLTEDTDPDFEINYIDIGSVDSNGKINEIVNYKFSEAPSRARRKVQHKDVILSTVRTYLRAIASIDDEVENLIVSTGFAVIRPNKNLFYPDFCKYVLSENTFIDEVQKGSVGVSYPAINVFDLGNIFVTVPSILQQKRIVEYLNKELSKIDSLIDKKITQSMLFEEKKKAVINQVITKGLNLNVPMKETSIEWLGKIPKNWELVKLKYLTDRLKYGANEAAEDHNYDDPRYIRITDIDENGNLKDETYRSISKDLAEDYILKDGDILLARSGATVGKSFLYRSKYGVSAYAGYLVRMRCNKKINSDFMYYFTLSDVYWNQISIDSIQATIQNYSGEKYANMLVIVPDYVEQEEISIFIKQYLKKYNLFKVNIKNSINRLQEKRSAIISAAINGGIEL